MQTQKEQKKDTRMTRTALPNVMEEDGKQNGDPLGPDGRLHQMEDRKPTFSPLLAILSSAERTFPKLENKVPT